VTESACPFPVDLEGAMAVSEDAVKLKEQGNKAFKEHDWPSAIALYSRPSICMIRRPPSTPTVPR